MADCKELCWNELGELAILLYINLSILVAKVYASEIVLSQHYLHHLVLRIQQGHQSEMDSSIVVMLLNLLLLALSGFAAPQQQVVHDHGSRLRAIVRILE